MNISYATAETLTIKGLENISIKVTISIDLIHDMTLIKSLRFTCY